MTDEDAVLSIKRLYRLTGVLGLVGFVWYFAAAGVGSAVAFLLGVLCSFGNLWLFDHLSRSIAPGADVRKPWQAGAYVVRYVILLGIGYAIVKSLDVSPLAVILGLFASAAAVLASLITELLSHFFKGRTSH